MNNSSQSEIAQHLHTFDRGIGSVRRCGLVTAIIVCVLNAALLLTSASSIADIHDQQAEMSMEQIDQLFEEAMAALDQQELQTARKRFESILRENPSLHRARLELARVYYLSFDYEKARQETLRVLEDPNTPPQVRVTLLAFLAQIDADKQELNKAHRWGASVYLGATYDSNVNVGPDQDIIDLNGTSLSLTDASLERSAFGVQAIAGVTHNYSPGNTFDFGERSGFFLWQSQANANVRPYFDEDDFNVAVLTLRTGPTWIVPRHWRAGIALQLDKLWLGNEALALFTSINPHIVWQRDGDWEYGLDFVHTQRDYDDASNAPREGDYNAGTATLSKYFVERELGLQAGLGYNDFNADTERFSHSGPTAFMSVSKAMWDSGSVYARLNWRDYDYRGVEPLFDLNRNDSELNLTIGFQKDLQWGLLEDWQLLGSASVIDNSSNVTIFDYRREQLNLGISRSF